MYVFLCIRNRHQYPELAALATMPTLTAARGHKRGSSRNVDYDAVWEIGQPGNISHNGQGLYSYVGDGGSNEEDIGTIRTLRPLNPSGGGLSSFEIKIVDTGESCRSHMQCVEA